MKFLASWFLLLKKEKLLLPVFTLLLLVLLLFFELVYVPRHPSLPSDGVFVTADEEMADVK